jgi:hypothetical protein
MRRTNKDKELDQLQRSKKEIERLKKQISSLRKQLSRIDVDRYENLKELLDKQETEDRQVEIADNHEKLLQEWKCKKCTEGHLEVVKYTRLNEIWYYRSCTGCNNRTRGKRFTEQVRGIFKSE